MSYWNFRVCKEKYKDIGDVWELAIREVYYNDDGSIWAVSKDGISAHGEINEDSDEAAALKDVKADLQRMQECTEKPILDLNTLEFACHEDEESIKATELEAKMLDPT